MYDSLQRNTKWMPPYSQVYLCILPCMPWQSILHKGLYDELYQICSHWLPVGCQAMFSRILGAHPPKCGQRNPISKPITRNSLGLHSIGDKNKLVLTEVLVSSGFPLDLENLEKWEYTWKTWKYHGILKILINIKEKWHETWKNLVATKKSPLTPLKQYKIH